MPFASSGIFLARSAYDATVLPRLDNRRGESGSSPTIDRTLSRVPDGAGTRLKVRSMVGLLPLCATTVVEPWQRDRIPKTVASYAERAKKMPELAKGIHPTGPGNFGVGERGITALVNPERLRRILTKMLDEKNFSALTVFGRCPSSTRSTPTSLTWRARTTGWTICRRNRTPACSAATPTGGDRSGCR